MALATKCPHCHTTFRVANDQLKLRAGLVRCGACKEIFNGIEHLLGAAPALPATAPLHPATEAEVASGIGASGKPASQTPDSPAFAVPDTLAEEPGVSMEEASRSAVLSASPDFVADVEQPEPSDLPQVTLDAAVDPLQRMTLMDFSDADHAADGAEAGLGETAAIDDPLDRVIEDLQRKPLRRSKKKSAAPKAVSDTAVKPGEPEVEEPGFVTLGRRRQKIGRMLRIPMAVGSFLLLLGVLAQGAYGLRNQIAARMPQAKPTLIAACAMIGCRIGLPTQIETLTIESSELQPVPGNKDMFVLTTLLRNDSGIVQAWPNIELTLNDTNDKALARRIFTPRDYLTSAQDVTKGFAPSSEQAVRLFFELAQLKASGYHVGLFYP